MASNQIQRIARALNVGNGIAVSLLILLVLIVVASVLVPNFSHAQNISNILRVFSSAGIMAIGLCLVMLTGEIDVSVGSIMSLSVMVSTIFLDSNEIVSLVVLVVVGAICGLINGILVAVVKAPSLMITIGTLSVFSGLSTIVVNAQYKYITEAYPVILGVAKSEFFGLPSAFLYCLTFAILTWIWTNRTAFGKSMYYVGANKRAAFMSGIHIVRVKIVAFVVCGILASISGMMIAAQIGRAKSDIGAGYEVTAIAIAVLGGTSLFGGRGSTLGVLTGMITLGVMTNILALSRMGSYMEIAMKGALVIAVVFVYELQRRLAR